MTTYRVTRPIHALAILTSLLHHASAAPMGTAPDVHIRHLTDVAPGANRMTVDPRDDSLVVLYLDGSIHRIDPNTAARTFLYTSTDHQLTRADGIAIATDGTIILTGNTPISANTSTVSTVTRGTPDPETGTHTWSVLAQTAPYPGGSRLFSHWMNAVAFDPASPSIFVNIGARTDHGEIQSDRDTFPTTRETGLTTILLKLPLDSTDLLLPNDRELLRSLGYLYCEGLRNTYDIAFDSTGNLFGVENGPDRDSPEELNWLQPGHHYGFPWRLGTEDNPQQFPNYDPAQDKLLNPNYAAVNRGHYLNDPTFPPPPNTTTFTDPIPNTGPHADKFRDTATGAIIDASEAGTTLSTFTAHRCPLGLTFDTATALPLPYTGSAFAVCWTPAQTPGTAEPGPFGEESQDLLHIALSPAGTSYQATVTRIASGFANPVDTAIIGDALYVLENRGSGGIWEISFPPTQPTFTLDGRYSFTLHGEPDTPYILESSTDLSLWTPVLNFNGSDTPLIYSHPTQEMHFFRTHPESP